MSEQISSYWNDNPEDVGISYDISIGSFGLLPSGNNDAEGKAPNPFEGDVVNIEWESGVEKPQRVDYALAVCCGAVSGIIDALFVGEFSLERAKEWGDSKVASFVKRIGDWERRRDGKPESDDLAAAIEYLEKKHGMAADAATDPFGGGKQHHFRDFSHHCSPVGLACSLFTQFTGVPCGVRPDGGKIFRAKAIGTDVAGNLLVVDIESPFIGSCFEEKLLFGTVDWFLHLVSDMAGSHASAGKGTGIPGPMLSLLKEISALPIFKETANTASQKPGEVSFRLWLSKLFNGTLLAKRDASGKISEPLRFDLRTEIGISHELGRRAIPVLVNECMVRAVYFLRRLYLEIKDKEISRPSELKLLDLKRLIPFNNAIIRRMVTVSSGSMVAVDAADAFVRAMAKNKSPKKTGFWIDFAVRINVVGVGRFFVACAVDAKGTAREAKWQKLADERKGDALASDIAAMDLLTLTISQQRILHSLEKLMLDYDIAKTRKDADRKAKECWRDEWIGKTLKLVALSEHDKNLYFVNAKELLELVDEERSGSESEVWIHLVLLEATFFSSYSPAPRNEGGRPCKVSLESDYLDDVFAGSCAGIGRSELKRVRKTAKRYRSALTGRKIKKIAGAVGAGALTLGTAGAAAYLAPVIAPILATTFFGSTVAGLSGAALTSASLALFGGGALAAGGFGMAGGTAVIAGGGALLGLAGGTGLSAAASVQALGSEKVVLDECVKILTFSDAVLVQELGRESDIVTFEKRLGELSEELKEDLGQCKSSSNAGAKDEKKQMKVLRRSEKYIRRTKELIKSLPSRESHC